LTRRWTKRLTEAEVRQRIVRLDAPSGFFPEPGVLFDLWAEDTPWAARIHREPRVCATAAAPRAADLPTDDLLSCAEVFAGLRWSAGSVLHFEHRDRGIAVWGALDP